MAVGVAGGVPDDRGSPDGRVVERVARVGMQAEVVVAALRLDAATLADPLLVVSHHEHRSIGRGAVVVEPLELLGGDRAGRRSRDRGVEECHRQPRQLDPLIAGVLVLMAVRVVVAAHHVETVTERRCDSTPRTPPTPRRRPSWDRSPFTITAAGSIVAISRAAERFITSGYGSAPGSPRRIGPSVRSSIRPASISPKWTSFTVAKRQRSSPCGRRERANRHTVEVVFGVGGEALVATCVEGRRGRRRGRRRPS